MRGCVSQQCDFLITEDATGLFFLPQTALHTHLVPAVSQVRVPSAISASLMLGSSGREYKNSVKAIKVAIKRGFWEIIYT